MATAKTPSESEIQTRGVLTQRIKDKSKELLGYEISAKELRLMPYVQYQMMNAQRIDPSKISSEEREIWQIWKEAGYVDGGMSGMQMTKEFYDALCEILFLGYIDIHE